MNKVFMLPDTDWAIINVPKPSTNQEYWYIIYHKHGNKFWATYRGGGEHIRNRRYKCTNCNETVPEIAEGFKNLCDWNK